MSAGAEGNAPMAAGASPTGASAGEEMRWRVTQHVTSFTSVDVPGLAGHKVGAGSSEGLAMFEGGQFATLAIGWTVDFVYGSGRHVFYTTFQFEDGASFTTRGEGETTASDDGRTATFEGVAAFLQGTGRFAGIRGRGTYAGKRFAPLGTGGAEVYLDYAMVRHTCG